MVLFESPRVVSLICAGVGVLFLVVGCGNRSPRVAEPVGETHTTASSTVNARPQGQDTPTDALAVRIAPDVRRACELPDEPPGELPRFDFDSARLRPRGEDILERLAACIAEGRLGDSRLEIVGHTDPRGRSSYNQQLGMYRAVAAKQHLVDLGVPEDRLRVDSRGALDAKGTNEATWALDRRVEIGRARESGGSDLLPSSP